MADFDFGGFVVDAFDVVSAAYDEAFVFAETCSGRDQMTADDVFFHALEGVGLAGDGCFVENLGGLLERCGRHEARSLECGAGDALEYLLGCGGHGVADGDCLEVAAFEGRVLVAELAGGDDLTGT